MKHFLLKFNHGVEIGARLAYLGHYKRTEIEKIYSIAYDELRHKVHLETILEHYLEEPNPVIDGFFWVVGSSISWACSFMPLFSLNWIARLMELFAMSNYKKLAAQYPEWAVTLLNMANSEKDHEEYFRLGPVRYQNLQSLRSSIKSGRVGERV